jgi:hypothetical protein
MNYKNFALSLVASVILAGCVPSDQPVPNGQNCVQKSLLSDNALQNLKQIRQDTAELKAINAEEAEYAKWLSGYLASYSKYLEQAGMYAPLIKIIPLPYAGQAGDFVKFGSKMTLHITHTATAIDNANKSIARYEELLKDANTPEKISATAKFAEERLLPDIKEADTKSATLKEMSAGLMGFGESVENILKNGTDTLAKAKALFGKEDIDKDKITKTAQFKQKLEAFKQKTFRIEELIKKDSELAKRAFIYSELAR